MAAIKSYRGTLSAEKRKQLNDLIA